MWFIQRYKVNGHALWKWFVKHLSDKGHYVFETDGMVKKSHLQGLVLSQTV